MNVVIVNDYDYIQGGASKIAIETANALVKCGHRVVFFCGVSAPSKSTLIGVEVVGVSSVDSLSDGNVIRGAVNGIYNGHAKKRLEDVLAMFSSDDTVVHVHGWTKALSSSVFSAVFNSGFRSVLTLHDFFAACPNGGFYNYRSREICTKRSLGLACVTENCDSRNYAFKMYRTVRQIVQNSWVGVSSRVDAYIYISNFSYRLLKPYLESTSAMVEYLPNPVTVERPHSRVKVEDNDYFLFVGRLSKEKGVEIFCRAAEISRKRAIVVGDGELLDELKSRFSSNTSLISFVGWKTPEEVAEYLRGARCFVFPSLWYETFGLTVCEALAFGVPCLVSSDTAATDFVDGKNGFIFPRNDAASLAAAMLDIDGDKKLQQMSEYAFNTYWSTPFSSERYENGLLGLYEKILSS